MQRWIAISDSLKILRSAGLDVRSVIDVGVQYDSKDLRHGFPDVRHFLFEPVEEYHSEIRNRYLGLDFELFALAVGEAPGEMIFEDVRTDAAGVVSHVVATTANVTGSRQIASTSLDVFVQAPGLFSSLN